jgi:hypothetical protein
VLYLVDAYLLLLAKPVRKYYISDFTLVSPLFLFPNIQKFVLAFTSARVTLGSGNKFVG